MNKFKKVFSAFAAKVNNLIHFSSPNFVQTSMLFKLFKWNLPTFLQISTYLLCPGFLTKEKCKINKKTYLGQTNANAASNEESIRMKNDKITCLLCKLSHYTFLMVYQVGDLHIPDKKSTIILIYWCILGNYSSKMRVFTHFSIILGSLLC